MQNRVLRSFGASLRKARQRAGLSQEALGDNSGLHRTYIGSIERGERNVSLVNIVRIAEALGLEPADLLHDLPSNKKRA